jgi:hypothetical protein
LAIDSAEAKREKTMKTDLEKVKRFTNDLRTRYPRSPREKLGGYALLPVAWINAVHSSWA